MSELAKKKNNQMDLLEGSIWKGMIKYTIPVAASSIIQQLFNATDVAVVGKFAGSDALAAVGSNSPVTALFINIFTGISVGVNVVIANFVGQHRQDEIKSVVHTAIKFALMCGIAILLLGQLIANPLLRLIDTPAKVLEGATIYLRIYFLGMPFMILYNFGAAILRSVGDTKRPMYCLIISGVLNVLLNLVLVIGFDLGVAGVAVATAFSSCVSATLVLMILSREEETLRLEIKKLKINSTYLVQIIKIGAPAAIQSAVFSLSNVVLQTGINSFGENAVGGSSTELNFEYIAYFVANAFSQGTITFVSQNYGAGNNERCRKIVRIGLIEGMVFTACFSIIFNLFAYPLVGIFTNNPAVIKYAVKRIRIVTILEAMVCLYEIPGGALRGMGHSLMPALFTIVGSVCFRILWMFTVFKKYHSFGVLMSVYPVSWALTTLMVFSAYIVMSRRLLKSQHN